MSIKFTWQKDFDKVMKAVEIIKVALQPFNYRVGWGSYFGYLERSYMNAIYGEELDQLQAMLETYNTGEDDSKYYNKFNNCFGDRHVYERNVSSDVYEKCMFTHKFEGQYEKVFGERAQKDIE